MNTNVKPVMSVAMQQRRQILMCSVSKCINYTLLYAVSCISLSQYIDFNFFAGEACLFVTSASVR